MTDSMSGHGRLRSQVERSTVLGADLRGRVLVLTLDRPDRVNAVDVALAEDLAAAVGWSEADPSVGGVVLTGAGGRIFCAGGDIDAIGRGEGLRLSPDPHGFGGLVRRRRTKPWLAAVNGAALGGGLEIALACEIRWCVPHATFGLPEVTLGLAAAEGGVARLMHALPASRAFELALTGDRITAEEAERWGLVSRVVPADALVDDAVAFIALIADLPAKGVRATLDLARGDEPDWTLAAATLRRLNDPAEVAGLSDRGKA